MKNEIKQNVQRYEKAHRRRSIWMRMVSMLSAVTVFFTTYALILPAITMEPSPGILLDRSFAYENEELRIDFHVMGRAAFEDEDKAKKQADADYVQLSVTLLDENSSVYEAYSDYAEENIGKDDLYSLVAIRLRFDYEAAALDMSGCQIEAEVTAKDAMMKTEPETPAAGFDEAAALGIRSNGVLSTRRSVRSTAMSGDTEQVLALTALEGVNTDLSEQDTVFLSDGVESSSLTTTVSGDTMAFALYSTINPSYTVQYYAHNTVLDDSGDVSIDVIDTSGGVLPTNSKSLPTVPAYLTSVGNGMYALAMHLELAPLYKEKTYEYVNAPGIAYINRLIDNGNFKLSEVWVLNDGKDPASVTRSDWTVYPANVSFTNRATSASEDRIYISDGSVIRLVYDEGSGGYTNAADFYDYDITDGDIHDANGGSYATSIQTNGKWYAQTYNQGINSFTASSGTVKLAFGNANTGTGLHNLTWNGNYLNRYNSSVFDGCTFGLVTGLNDDGTLIFADGISAPKLFGTTEMKGKTHFDDYSLQFIRYGDTYTLSAVNGTETQMLNLFNNPSYVQDGESIVHDHIFTNNFWPMDYAYTWGANGHDLKFGDVDLKDNRRFFQSSSTFYTDKSNTKNFFPIGDDGLDHNSYFGMHFDVTFSLTEDYLGPLEYLFYGDDDLWVFLDGQLICDIGGVHSSVGQYVNLWDYISKMPDDQKYGEHELRLYYTERGASGSTCFMQFTLPSVSVDTPQLETNSLELGKQVENTVTDQEFEFTVELLDASGQPLMDDYSYTLYNTDGSILGNGIINSDEKTIYLQHGQKLIIDYLPDGVQYRITETAAAGFHTVYKIGTATSSPGNTASGTITEDTSVIFINSTGRALPETGGRGVALYLLPLAVAAAYACCLPAIHHWADSRKKAA